MISLTCTECQTVLSIDEAFAGGVCRCQHCGTIQTVPSHLKKAAPVGAGAREERAGTRLGPKALYQARPRGESRGDGAASGTGLEDLADVVASSGLSNSGLSNTVAGARRSARQAPPKAGLFQGPFLFIGGALATAIIAVILWLAFGRSSTQTVPTTPSDTNTNSSAPGSATIAAAGPAFCGQPLTGTSIVYILDRGDSAKDIFDLEKEVTYRSIQSLGADHKFQMLLWDNKTSDERYPSDAPTFATRENLDACRRTFDDVIAYHQSDIKAPLTRAVGVNPDTIVIVTAKGFDLDNAFVADVQGIRKTSSVKIDTFSLRGTESAALQTVAKNTGGTYKVLSDGDLRAALSP